MNKTISVIRMATLISLGIFASLLLLGEEQGASPITWALRFILDKMFGFGAAFLLARLYKTWSRTDPWLMACNKVFDNNQSERI